MGAKQPLAQRKFAPGTSRGARSVETLALQIAKAISDDMARDEDTRDPRKVAIGQRIKALRDPMPQQKVIDNAGLDVTLRAYQAWEAGDSGISWDNLERLAGFFGVTTEYLLSGVERRASPDQLDRIESKLDEALSMLHASAALDALDAIETDQPGGRARTPRRRRAS